MAVGFVKKQLWGIFMFLPDGSWYTISLMLHYSFLQASAARGAAMLLFLAALAASTPGLRGEAPERVKLFVRETPLTVHGKETTVTSIQQEDGTLGYFPEQSEGFHVDVVNELRVPTCLHWHGMILPNSMDGVPFVTQDPIPPGGSQAYNFPLQQSGTYWIHSHYGLQEQFLLAAPFVIWNDKERAKADKQFVVMLSDFSFTPPAEILEKLIGSSGMKMKPGGMESKEPTATDLKMGEGMKMEGMDKDSAKMPVIVQQWDEKTQRFIRAAVAGKPANADVHYDALLANRKTIDAPEILAVDPGDTVLLRLIGASCATNFFVDTGSLDAELLAVDGCAVKPLRGNFFQLAVAQRIDLRVTIPQEGGAFPVVAQGEGTELLAGVVLSTKGAEIPSLPKAAKMKTASLDNTQERLLVATQPLETKKTDRLHPAEFGGTMVGYTWTINGKAYPNRDALVVKNGERVEIVISNTTGMGHPVHKHDGFFQVVEIDGEPVSGACRDTVFVPPGSKMKIAFDANNPGIWAFHCHILYHSVRGMFTVVKYEDTPTPFWQPGEAPKMLKGLRN